MEGGFDRGSDQLRSCKAPWELCAFLIFSDDNNLLNFLILFLQEFGEQSIWGTEGASTHLR